MAAKRITQTAINWAALAERVPEHQKHIFSSFKAKSDVYLRKALALPENPPAIDWNFYKSKVPIAGMVDDFQKQYTAINIPYPPDTVKGELDSLENEVKINIAKFKTESEARIAEFKEKLAHIESLIPYDQMTMEDFKDAHPDLALDPINRPTFWPHDEEQRLDYVHKDQPSH